MDSKIPPHLAHVATLPCETLMSAKQAINDKLQGSVALRCGWVVNNQIKEGLLLSLRVNFFKSVNMCGKVTNKNVIVSCACALGQRTANTTNLRISVVLREHVTSLVCLCDWLKA